MTEFLSAASIDKNLNESISDIVYTAPLKDGSPGYISLLAEHQSTPRRIMPLRLLRYQLNIMEEHFNQCPKGNKKVPVVFCFVFYNGKRKPYPYSLDIFDLFYSRELGKQALFKAAKLIDITSMSD
jgi:predicted transposase YdaD